MSKGKKKVILIRGIPGCGKSTHVEEIRFQYSRAEAIQVHHSIGPDFAVCSADRFFMKRVATPIENSQEGKDEYVFDPTKLAQAHSECFIQFLRAIDSRVAVIVVDNTFVHQWEMETYIKTAEMNGYDVVIQEIRVSTIAELKECIRRNVHGVPAESIARMAVEFEPDTHAKVISFKFRDGWKNSPYLR